MKVKSLSGLVCYVKDLEKTWQFYQDLGFRPGKKDETFASVYINWFWIEFVAIDNEEKAAFQKEAHANPKGGGLYINISVENVDEFYKEALAKGMKPSTEPRDWPHGRREFVLRDPDGYKLVFFEKK